MSRLVVAVLLCAACSQPATREGQREDSGREPGVKTPPTAAAGLPIAVDGELGACNPAGVWRAVGSFPGGGDCIERPASLSLEVTVVARGGGFALQYTGDGELVPDRLAARDGVCAMGFTVRTGEGSTYAHLLASGAGRGVWDAAECTDAIVFEVSRGARSAE